MDKAQIRHDLALAYAKTKLQVSIERGELVHDASADEAIEAAHALAHWYHECLEELCQLKDAEIFDAWSMGLE